MDDELRRNMESGDYTVVTADGEVLNEPENSAGVIVVVGQVRKPMLRITDTSDDANGVANLSFRVDPDANMLPWEPDDDEDRNYQLLGTFA